MGNWQAKLFIVVLVALLAPGVRSASADCGKDHGKQGAASKEEGAGCEHGCDKAGCEHGKAGCEHCDKAGCEHGKAGCEHGCDKAACKEGGPCTKDAAAKAEGCEKDAASAACEAKATAAPKPGPGEAVYVLGIEGMSCAEACPPQVKQSIESIEGVRSVEVDFADKRAVVRTDENVELTTAKVDKTFQNHGYFVSSLEKVPAK